MNKKQGIFEMWLKNFLALVFMQSFQAIFLAVVVMIMGQVIDKTGHTISMENFEGLGGEKKGYFVCSIVAYVGITAVIKLQKLVKGIFGIDDSPLLGDMSKSMKSLMHTAWHAVDMGKDFKKAVGAASDAKGRRDSARNYTNRLKSNTGKINQLASGASVFTQVGGSSVKSLQSATNLEGKNINISGVLASNGGNNSKGYSRDQIAALFADSSNFDGDKFVKRDMADQMLADAKKKEMDAEREFQSAKTKAAVRVLSQVAGLGIASGASDSAEETIAMGNYLSDALTGLGNVATKPIANSGVKKVVAKQLKQNEEELQNYKDRTIKEQQELSKSINTLNEAIVDSTKDIKTRVKMPKVSEVKKSIQTAADDWLNTQFTTPKQQRVTRKEVKEIIEVHREVVNKDREKSRKNRE